MSETPRQKGRPKDPLKTQAILQAARKLFLEQGLEVTTAEIARVAGVAKATLYANFSDKEHLIEAVLRQESDLTISDHDFAQRHHLPLIEVLTAFGYRFVRFINQLYPSDAAGDLSGVDLGGRRVIQQHSEKKHNASQGRDRGSSGR
ncbi:TetR family transcriptional regulator, partial [Klebsiella pneumoniae]|uniref:TetR family transcriptional regulator n=1 Tax=Klebsiella pneumoniae TaxID=573 RepID=UPI000ADB9604